MSKRIPIKKSSVSKISHKTIKPRVKVVSAPVVRSAILSSSGPQMTTTRGGTRIAHSEFIQDLSFSSNDGQFHLVPTPSSAGAIQGWAINPGNQDMFPWLAVMATRFEKYRFKKLQYRYEPMLPTSTTGGVYLVIDYDAVDPPPASKVQMLNYKGMVRSPVWQRFTQSSKSLDLVGQFPWRNTLNDLPSAVTDPRIYNVGNLFIGYDDVTLAAARGELWVDYEIELITPQLNSQSGEVSYQLPAGNANTNFLANATPVAGNGSAVRTRPDLGTTAVEFLRNGTFAYNTEYTTSAVAAVASQDAFTRISGGTVVANAWAVPAVQAFANGITSAQMANLVIANAPTIVSIVAGALNAGTTLSGTVRFTPL